MRRHQLLLPALVLCIALLSCEKYLDVPSNNLQSPIRTADDCQRLLDNYGQMNVNYPSDGNLSCDDYSADEVLYGSELTTQEDRAVYTWQATAIRQDAGVQWQVQYYRVYNANLILEYAEKIGKEGGTDAAVLGRIRGAALFFRAYSFWQVAQLYARPYNAASAGQDPGIPLRLVSDFNDKSSRGTLEQTYGRIVADLQEAVGLLDAASTLPSRPNKAACYAMLARVYQSMEDYPAALTSASAALELNSKLINFNTLDKDTETPFNPHYNKEVIFHSTTAQNILLTPNAYGAYPARIDAALSDSYGQNDLRREILLKVNADGSYHFTGNYEPAVTAELFNGLAVDELYLVRAESYARAGNAASAMEDLNTLLLTRWKQGTYVSMTAASAEEALGLILVERRKELLMRGMRWTDLRRLNRDSRFAVTLQRTVAGETYTLPPNDARYTLLIPAAVIRNSDIEQNTR